MCQAMPGSRYGKTRVEIAEKGIKDGEGSGFGEENRSAGLLLRS